MFFINGFRLVAGVVGVAKGEGLAFAVPGGVRTGLMRIALRIIGTWLIGLALVLVVIDGTKSLAANEVVMTTLGSIWMQIHAQSLDAVRLFFETRFFSNLLDGLLEALLTYPAFAVIGVPGVVLALLGRRHQRDRFLRTEKI